jgi:hypothetical protein
MSVRRPFAPASSRQRAAQMGMFKIDRKTGTLKPIYSTRGGFSHFRRHDTGVAGF